MTASEDTTRADKLSRSEIKAWFQASLESLGADAARDAKELARFAAEQKRVPAENATHAAHAAARAQEGVARALQRTNATNGSGASTADSDSWIMPAAVGFVLGMTI